MLGVKRGEGAFAVAGGRDAGAVVGVMHPAIDGNVEGLTTRLEDAKPEVPIVNVFQGHIVAPDAIPRGFPHHGGLPDFVAFRHFLQGNAGRRGIHVLVFDRAIGVAVCAFDVRVADVGSGRIQGREGMLEVMRFERIVIAQDAEVSPSGNRRQIVPRIVEVRGVFTIIDEDLDAAYVNRLVPDRV